MKISVSLKFLEFGFIQNSIGLILSTWQYSKNEPMSINFLDLDLSHQRKKRVIKSLVIVDTRFDGLKIVRLVKEKGTEEFLV